MRAIMVCLMGNCGRDMGRNLEMTRNPVCSQDILEQLQVEGSSRESTGLGF